MSGPAPKHASVRARRNAPSSSPLRALPAAGRAGSAPPWPLLADTERTAQRELADDRVASLTGEIERADDGRTKGRLRRQLAQAEQASAILRLQVEQQSDMEIALWQLLWATPQATMWEESAAFARVLASFVRWHVKGEQGDLEAAKEARIRGKDFGLTPLALLGLKAEVERVEQAEDHGRSRRAKATSQQAAKVKAPEGDPRQGLYSA